LDAFDNAFDLKIYKCMLKKMELMLVAMNCKTIVEHREKKNHKKSKCA
jgi:hypothetical protein